MKCALHCNKNYKQYFLIISMIDLSIALNCIEEMKACGTYRGHKSGVVMRGFGGIATRYSPGKVVLYREELTPLGEELRMGECRGVEQKPTERVTVETPLTPEQISGDLGRGLIRTIGTMIGVPQEYVEELRV